MNLDLTKLHNGLMGCPLYNVPLLMPEIWDLVLTAPCVKHYKKWSDISDEEPIIDAKVHMLMPGQYPCIPNWHCDFVPRNENGNLDWNRNRPWEQMNLLVTGHPLPEFRDKRQVLPNEWITFTQEGEHRGTVATTHCWRLFIRVTPESIHPAIHRDRKALRRHSQVYLDAANFTW